MSKLAVCSVAIIACAALSGCAAELEEEFATAVVTSSLETPRKQSAAQEVADSLGEDCDEMSAATAAQEAAGRPAVGLYPSSCVAKTADGADLHAQYSGCTGAFGQVEISGGLDASFEVTGACMLRADIVDSGDLTANGKALDYEAIADIEVVPGKRLVDWNAHWTGTTRRDRDIEQSSQLRVDVDHLSSCLLIGGTAEGTIDNRFDYGTQIEGLAICPDECPSAGVVEAHWQGYARERSVTVTFDGSDMAHVDGWTGREFDVKMVCQPVVADAE